MKDSPNGRGIQGRAAEFGYGEWALVMTADRPEAAIDPARVPERFRGILEEMRSAEPTMRRGVMGKWIEAQADAEALGESIDAIGPDDPAPADAETIATEGEAWPPLRITETPPAAPFPVDAFPPSLATFCREVAESTRSAIDIPALGMLTVAGAAIGSSVEIRLKRTWSESALLYAVAIAPPGRSKTPALRLVVQPLVDIDKRLRDESDAKLAEWLEAKRAHDKDDSAPAPGPPPPQLRAITKDITRESLAIVLADNPRGVLRYLDEALAWANGWNQYKGGKGTDEQSELSLYSRDPISVDRKGGREAIHVMHPFAAFLGGIQPKLVRKLRGEDGADNGFLHRIAFAFPDAFPARTWTEQEVSEEAERDWTNAIERLHSAPMREIGDDVRPWIADLRPEAKARFTKWFNANGSAMAEADDEDRQGEMAKAEGRLARLALILSRLRLACDPSRPLLEGDRVPPVELEDMEGAIRLTAYFDSHAERVAGVATEGARTADALSLLKWIKRHCKREFREADASKHLRRFRDDPAALADALRTLKEAGAIRPKPEPAIPGKRGPKPSPLHEVRPELLEAPQISGNSAN